MNPANGATALALEHYYAQPVALTLGRLRDLVNDLLAVRDGGGAPTLAQLRSLLHRHDQLDLAVGHIATLLSTVEAMPAGATAADMTPRQIEDLLATIQ